MLAISPIKNVQSTINNISFTSGVRTNTRANVVNATPDSKHEGSFVTDFLGTVKLSPIFRTLHSRQQSIEKGLEAEQKKIDAIA